MKIRIIKYFMVAVATAVVLSSCQDDDISQINNNNNNPKSSLSDTSIGKSFTIRFKEPQKTLTKGYMIDHENDESIETGTAFFAEDESKTFKTMKVYRQSDPSKYFYVMLTNLDIPYPFDLYLQDSTQVITTECGPYANDRSYVKTYGLLYSKYGADHIKDYILMKLPVIKNGKEVKNRKRLIHGRLMNSQDLSDLLEIDDINNLNYLIKATDYNDLYYDPEDPKTAYYNAFVFGLKLTTKRNDANHTLCGYRDRYNVDDPDDLIQIKKRWIDFSDYELKQLYTKDCAEINHCGVFWMATEGRYRYSLTVIQHIWMSEDFNWMANYRNEGDVRKVGDLDFGYAVRLVFDPFNN